MTPLRQLLKEANYDDALRLVHGTDVRTAVSAVADPVDRLRLSCMSSDVLDYGGSYDESTRAIEEAGRKADHRLSQVEMPADIVDPAYMKQECWALMVWGMALYRRPNQGYTDAMRRFELAKKILLKLQQSHVQCTGSLARAWYCVGLVHRQRKDYRLARSAFASCIELTGIGINARKGMNQSTSSFDYNLARCYGLGIGWIAYDEALLSEAKSALVIANRLLMGKRVRFIRAYVDVIRAAAHMSGSIQLERIDEGIGQLLKTYHEILAPVEGGGHSAYALRAANEIAQGYLRRARVFPSEKDASLDLAEEYLTKVTNSTTNNSENRTQSNALIISSRILRERRQYPAALDAAFKARNVAGGLTFSRIDSCITVGEAAYEMRDYRVAIESFKEAIVLGRGSRKITGVCHLHLSRTYLADGQLSMASDHFKEWEALEPEIDNAFMSELANRVRQLLVPIKDDFRISHSIVNLNAKHHERLFHAWLAKNAMSRAGDDYDRAGDLLGIKRGAVQLWLRNESEATEVPET